MKRIFLLTVLLFLFLNISCINANEYVLKSNDIRLKFELTKSNFYLKSLSRDNTEFIKEPNRNSNLWVITVKRDKNYDGPLFELNPSKATAFKVNKTNKSIEITWYDVRDAGMSTGFDVTCSIKLEKDSAYWDISITDNKDFGIWSVAYPNITNIDAQDGDQFIWPARCGNLCEKFSDPRGFRFPLFQSKNRETYTKTLWYLTPIGHQFVSLSKNNTTLYLCPEDVEVHQFTNHCTLYEPNKLNYLITNYPGHMAEAGYEYKQAHPFNLTLLKGDYYDACKYYRKWGIKNKYGCFAKGPIESREDLPGWYKENPVWLTWHWGNPKAVDDFIKIKEKYDVPMACHVYQYSIFPFDTHYPNYLPVKEEMKEALRKMQNAGIKIMPYTNGFVIDTELSDAYEKYGDALINLDEYGKPREMWPKNVYDCPDEAYSKHIMEEMTNLMKEINFDALYFDQVGNTGSKVCFNPLHKHPMGGGDP